MNKCESCGMPLDDNVVSHHDARYCMHCQDQETKELLSYEEVREGSILAAVELMGKTLHEAEAMADEMLPQLPRWKGMS